MNDLMIHIGCGFASLQQLHPYRHSATSPRKFSNLQHWRGSSAIFVPGAAPVLDFNFSEHLFTSVRAEVSKHAPAKS
ncbi:MAG: hypothetical protein LH481_12350, partial [Burkholderiales bacterium]|nr:hypothetical protein [Burkholderiales bacterium]